MPLALRAQWDPGVANEEDVHKIRRSKCAHTRCKAWHDLTRLYVDLWLQSGDGSIDFSEFVNGVMRAHSAHNSLNLEGNDLQEKSRQMEKQRQIEKQAGRNRSSTLSVDVEQLLLEKIEQRTKGGPYNLFRAFRKASGETRHAHVAAARLH